MDKGSCYTVISTLDPDQIVELTWQDRYTNAAAFGRIRLSGTDVVLTHSWTTEERRNVVPCNQVQQIEPVKNTQSIPSPDGWVSMEPAWALFTLIINQCMQNADCIVMMEDVDRSVVIQNAAGGLGDLLLWRPTDPFEAHARVTWEPKISRHPIVLTSMELSDAVARVVYGPP